MALSDVLQAKAKSTGETPETKFVGMKLDYADYQELCNLVGTPEGAGGAACFKKMLSIVLEAKG